jgi:lysophospholipase L1-like esterase
MKITYLKKTLLALGIGVLVNACTSAPAGQGSTSGGSSGSGATTGGASGSGGSMSSGGSSASGGTVGSGGSTAAGGTTSTGGSKASGGTTSLGGTTATGGIQSNGGATGGTTGTGGSKASGGVVGSGGLSGLGGATGSGGTLGLGGSTHTGKWQIMPLGDSITGTTCYPKLLAKELIDKGHSNFTFVGTVLNNQGCGTGVDNVQTEGHGGYLVTYLISDANKSQGKGSLTELTTWAAEKPEVVLMEYGTNDVWSSIAPADITSAYSFVVDQFRGQNPNVIFFVAQITPMNPSGCTDCETRVEAFNAQIPAWATGKSTTASPIYVVNVWSALQPASGYTPNSTYTSDGVHPNPAGSQLMADTWSADLVAHAIP